MARDGSPLAQVATLIAEAGSGAMTLATADASGAPHARTVLVTAVDDTSLRFHSSTPTTKTRDLTANPRACGVFHWPALGRQVVLQGSTEFLDAAVSRAAYPTRARPLQLLAWAYDELTPDAELAPGAVEAAFAAATDRTGMPASWTTVRLVPAQVDLWRAGTESTPPSRTRYVRHGDGWRSHPVLP